MNECNFSATSQYACLKESQEILMHSPASTIIISSIRHSSRRGLGLAWTDYAARTNRKFTEVDQKGTGSDSVQGKRGKCVITRRPA